VVPVTDTVTNFADVRDMARGHLLAAERGRRGESYLLGHVDLTAEQLAREALSLFDLRRPIVRAPFPLAHAVAHASLAAARLLDRPPLFTPAAVRIAELGLAADCTKAVRDLGLPQTPIRTALRDALSWFAQHGYLTDGKLKRRILAAA